MTDALLPQGAVIDRYEVTGWIGQGGMAAVYAVRHRVLGSEHVLKVLTVEGRELAARLVLEGRVQASLKHPNVVEVTDVVDVDGSPGLVMAYVRGPSLDRVLGAGEPLPLAVIDQLVPGILAGVAVAHAAGLVHRDLKPANILLSLEHGRVVPKVADFGLVKRLDDLDGRTRTGTTMGTPQYMAPEQIRNARHVDARCDLFAVGCILYELVCGCRAYDGDSAYEIFRRVVEREHRPVTHWRPDAPPSWVAAIEAALADRDGRVPDCESLWAIWCAGDRTLADTAPASCPPALLARWAELAPVIASSGRSTRTPTPAGTWVPSSVRSAPLLPPDAATPTTSAPLVAPRPGAGAWVAVGGGALAAALALWTWRRSPEPTPPAPAPAPIVAPSLPSSESPRPEPEPTPVPDTPTPAPPPVAPVAHPPSVAPQPSPGVEPPPEPLLATVSITGSAEAVVAVSGPHRHPLPGPIPAGTWLVEATFHGRVSVVGTFTFAPGELVRLDCQLNSCVRR